MGVRKNMTGEAMNRDRIWSFTDLKNEVIAGGTCGKCGGCVSFCSANRIGALKIGENGFPDYEDQDKCLTCGLCYMVCPQTHPLQEEIDAASDWEPPIGHFNEVFSARSADKDILEAGTDGGVVTALLVHLLENGFIDGAAVSISDGPFKRRAIVATSREELLQAAGSHWAEVPHLEEVGEGYTNFVPVIRTIHELEPKKLKKIALVGTPCQIGAVRKMQVLNIVPSDIVVLTIGLFCMQCFEIDHLMDKGVMKKHNLKPEVLDGLNIKDDFMLKLKSGLTVHVPLEEIEELARPACLACKLFANDYADISVGGLGSPDGYTTVMIRTTNGRRMFADAVYDGSIEYRTRKSTTDYAVEMSTIVSRIVEFAGRKMERGIAYREKYKS